LDEAILDINKGETQAVLLEVEEFVPGAKVLTELATVLDGEWYFNDERRLNMAKVVKAAKRNVEEDLIGGSSKKADKKTKVAAKKEAKGKPGRKAGGGYQDDQRIKILKPKMEFKDGSNNAVVFEMMKKAGTIGAYKKARLKKFGKDDVGGVLSKMVREGIVAVR